MTSYINNLPERTIERLSEYRRTLLKCLSKGKTHIYSHDLANMHAITAVQVRRDIMLIGFTSDTKKGYDVEKLIQFIGDIIDAPETQNVGIIGMGNLARAITVYFNDKRSKLKIVASFDIDPEKVGARVAGIPCYHVDNFLEKVKKHNIKIVILTLPANVATEMIEPLNKSGIKGLLNFTSTTLNLDSSIFVEDYNIITLLEKVGYFAKIKSQEDKLKK